MLTAVLGGVVASWIVSLLNTMFNDDQMVSWGWRIPFLSSFIVAVLGIISQRHMEQSFEFVNASQHGQITKSNPIKDALKLHWKNILLIMFAVIPWCAGGYITFTFLPIYLQSQHRLKHALLVSSFLMLWMMGWLIVGGIIADKYNYYISMKIGSLILCLWSIPAYLYMKSVYIDEELNGENDNYWPLIISDFISAIGLGLFGGPMQIFMVDSIQDVIVRYSAIGIAYNGCQAIFGGTAPLIGSALSLENFVYVGVYLTIFCGISTIILHVMSRYDSKDKQDFGFIKPDPL